ncbi:MAG: hypothetical protein AAGD06_16260 [Acidobacteriota bacterium]
MPNARRYPILIALLHETAIDPIDEVVDLFNPALNKADARSRRELEDWRVSTARATNEKVDLFSQLGSLVLDEDVPDDQLRQKIFEEVAPRDQFMVAVDESERLLRPLDGSHVDFVANRYRHLRKFAPAVLEALDFKGFAPRIR